MTDPGAWVIPFGKHKGKPLADVPMPYLRWLLANATDLRPDTRATIEAFMSNPGQRGTRAPKASAAEHAPTCARCGLPGSEARPLVHAGCAGEEDVPF